MRVEVKMVFFKLQVGLSMSMGLGFGSIPRHVTFKLTPQRATTPKTNFTLAILTGQCGEVPMQNNAINDEQGLRREGSDTAIRVHTVEEPLVVYMY